MNNRYRDYVGFPPLLRSGENDGKSFSDFYRASQIELLSALDNVLSQKAEDTLNQFAAVKKAEVNFQTSLGHRKGQLGINLIGAFAERQNNAFGWQVRVYGAQQDGKGFNAGVFYRHITDIALFGANAFVDYENHKLGNFYRYSIGGEAQNQYGSFAANYYVPITDEKRKDGGVIFSRKGYDAKLRLNIPNAKFLKAAIDYYNFGEEHGAESDDGFRYGAEAHLIPGLRLGVFYDDGGEELGGEVSYIHTIGEVQQAQTANEQWVPDLFAAVSREHSQRIVSVNVSVAPIVPSFDYSNRNIVRPANNAIIGTVNIPAGYFPPTVSYTVGILANTIFSVATTGGIVRANIAANSPLNIIATISINANVATYATAFIISLNVLRASPPSFQSALGTVEVGASAAVGILNIPPGFFDNTPAINPLSPGLTASGNTLIWQPTTRGLQNLSVEVSGTPSSQNATLLITATGFQRFARVNATLRLVDANTDFVVSTRTKFLIALPPAGTPRPFALTITPPVRLTVEVLVETRDTSNLGMVGQVSRLVHLLAISPLTAYTITVVQGSEEMQPTLYAQADIPFNIPGFLPPQLPQLPKLAFAAPVILAPAPQGRESNIPMPPLAAEKARMRRLFSRHSRAGGNQLAAGRRMLMAQSAI